MTNEWERVDSEKLRALYEQKQRELTAALLSGASWQEVQAHRKEVTDLAIALYRRTQAEGSNPAEHGTRSEGV